ncbi:MAG: hypothetical protein II956_06600 [Bacteroidales bacterium]|nr:hypothetical protein [Bacteroidales bacterium]
MSQPIITTDISAIRPVFSEGTAENIKRYTQLKKMFHHGREYSVLAEPMLDGPQKITWHTEFEGTPQPFSSLSEDEKNKAKGVLKYQVNKLYKAVFKQLYRNSMDDVADMFAILDSCIEIPDYDNIYRVQNTDGKSKYVLIKWGFISDDYSAQSELVKKLIPTAVDTVKIKVIKNQKAAQGESVVVVYNGKPSTLTTDSKGFVFLEDIPLGSNFSVKTPDGETITEYLCDGSDEYHFLIGTQSLDMNFVITDSNGLALSDTEVSFTYDGKTYFETTDSNGKISLKDIPEGTEVVVKQRNMKETYICNASMKEYAFTGSRPTAEIDVAVMSDKGEFLPGVDVKFTYQDKEITFMTDRNGRVSNDNFPPETEFKIECSAPDYQKATITLFSHEGLNMAEVKIKKVSSFGSMTIKVVDDQQKPIVNTLIRCENDDRKIEVYTDENGEFIIDRVNYNSDVICTQIINSLASHRHVFTFTADNSEYVFKGGKILDKSKITDVEILVINKRKEKVPNLSVTIDGMQTVLNKVSDKDGRILLPALKRGNYTVSTEFHGKYTMVDCEWIKEKEVLRLVVGKRKYGFLFWLLPLLVLLGFLAYYLLTNKKNSTETGTDKIIADTVATDKDNSQNVLQPPVDTTTINAADTIAETPKEGITMSIYDEKTGNTVPGAKISLEYGTGKNKTKIEGVADENGMFNFKEVPMDSTLQINAKITADGRPDYITKFLFSPEKKIMLPEFSEENNDIPVGCGETVKSKGFHSTIQTVRVDKTSGNLTIGYDMFDIPDEIIVYNGKAGEISDSKIIYKSNGFVKGPFKKATFKFEDPEGLVTVRINGGDNKKTEWYFKVYCPSKNQKNQNKGKK